MDSIRPANFLEHYASNQPSRSPWMVFSALACVLFLGVISLLAARSLLTIAEKTQRAKDYLLYSVSLYQDQQFGSARIQTAKARGALQEVSQGLRPWRFIVVIPFVGRQYTALKETLSAIDRLALAFERTIIFSDTLVTTVVGNKPLRLGEITPAQKRLFLAKLFEAGPTLQGIKADIDLAILSLNKVPDRFLLPPLADAVRPLKEQLPRVNRSIRIALPLLEALPLVSGYPEKQTYLFLFQNNDELRPTGGFIGTYGILKLRDGEIESLFTDNIYRLDRLAERQKKLKVAPPEPIKGPLGLSGWFLRDANWSPDFPTAARQALWFYQRESNDTEPIDGVLAITPTVVVRLLQLLGSITIDRVTFTPENLVDTLQFHVEKGYVDLGLPDVERKEVIGKLTKEIVNRLLALPLDKIPDLLDIVEGALRERHILVYETNPTLQAIAVHQGWDGSIAAPEGDFLMVVDANLAALKTDSVMDRSISYTVKEEQGRLKGNLTITYRHKGIFTWKTTRYQTYTRVYVPRGAELIRSDGFTTFSKKPDPRRAIISEEIGKTVFGGYLIIEPGTTKTLTLEYLLPRGAEQNPYTLSVQKQAGTEGHPLHITLQFDKTMRTWQPTGFTVERKGNTLTFPTDLRVDRQFKVFF